MTDNQTIAGALAAGLSTIAIAIRWGSARLAKSRDRYTMALLESARSQATLGAKFDAFATHLADRSTRSERIIDLLARPATRGRTTGPATPTRPMRGIARTRSRISARPGSEADGAE